jgi:hypothetical protein
VRSTEVPIRPGLAAAVERVRLENVRGRHDDESAGLGVRVHTCWSTTTSARPGGLDLELLVRRGTGRDPARDAALLAIPAVRQFERRHSLLLPALLHAVGLLVQYEALEVKEMARRP